MKWNWRPTEHIKHSSFWRHSVKTMPTSNLLSHPPLLVGFLATWCLLLTWAPLRTVERNSSSSRRLPWVPPGPRQLLMSKNFPRRIRTDADVRRYVESLTQGRRKREENKVEAKGTSVPGYMLSLRDRHSQEWTNFGEGGSDSSTGVGKLGPITAIRHHRHSGTQITSVYNGQQSSQGYQRPKSHSMTFRIAPLPKVEQLVAGSLRLPYQQSLSGGQQSICDRPQTIAMPVKISGIAEETHSHLTFEPEGVGGIGGECRGWISIPLPSSSLHLIMRRWKTLRLQFELEESQQPQTGRWMESEDEAREPHVITFHRDVKLANRLQRRQRDTDQMQGQLITHPPSQPEVDQEKKQTRFRRQMGPVKSQSRKRRHRYYANSPQYMMNKRYLASTCQRRDLMVNFEAVGWSRWVIAPTAYNAGYCFGHCPFPLSSHFNTTNHAIIIHLVSSLKVAKIPAPCCVPLSFSAQSLLYFDDGEVVLQVYENMVVETCGCR